MEFKQIATFVTLAEHLHFGHAAEHLNIAQPHVSRRIKQLEYELGSLLFYRDRRNVKLTEAGEVFLVEARRLLRAADIAKERTRESALGRRGHLNVSLLGSAMLGPLSTVFGEFHRRFPDVYLRFKEAALDRDHRGSQRRRHRRRLLSPADSRLRRLSITSPSRSEPLIAVLPKLIGLHGGRSSTLIDLAPDPWVMFPRDNGTSVYDLIISLCQKVGFSPNIVQEADSVQSRLGLVAAGFGVHLVHQTWRTVPYPGVAYVPVQPTATIGLSCYWRKDNTNPILGTFIETVRKYEL